MPAGGATTIPSLDGISFAQLKPAFVKDIREGTVRSFMLKCAALCCVGLFSVSSSGCSTPFPGLPDDSPSESILAVGDAGIVRLPVVSGVVEVLLRRETGQYFDAPAFDPGRGALYYVDTSKRKIMRWGSKTASPVEFWLVPPGYLPSPHSRSIALAVSPDGERLLASFTGGGYEPHLVIINTKQGESTEVDLRPRLSKMWNRCYWKDSDSILVRTADELFELNRTTHALKTVLKLDGGMRFALSIDRKTLIVLDGSRAWIYDAGAMKLRETFPLSALPGYDYENFALGEKMLYCCRGGKGASMLGLPDVGGIYAMNIESKQTFRVAKGPMWLTSMSCLSGD
jgi:hypothetical protein